MAEGINQKTLEELFSEALERLSIHFPNDINIFEELLGKPGGIFVIIEIIDAKLNCFDYLDSFENSFETKARKIWNDIGFLYRLLNRIHDALLIYQCEYSRTIEAQIELDRRVHKGAILYWISDCFDSLGYFCLSKRYMMLALCEDTIYYSGEPDTDKTGTYHRLVWNKKISKEEYVRYSRELWEIYNQDKKRSRFPEWMLQNIDNDWMSEIPTPEESVYYVINEKYCWELKKGLGLTNGKNLEILIQYLLSCIPGCITSRRVRSCNTDYDILCTLQGNYVDFRAELNKYFICECKDWKKATGVSAVDKFYRVIKSVKTNFGLFVSTKGISGQNKFENSDREIVKIFQSDGIVIVTIDESEIDQVIAGASLISILRKKYEKIRFDLP